MSDLGTIGELKSAAHFAAQGYFVFMDTSGKAPFDLVVYKDRLQRVQVKSTRTKTPEDTGWIVTLKSHRPNRSGTKRIPFDNTTCDLLCVYIEPEDRVVVLESATIKSRYGLVVK